MKERIIELLNENTSLTIMEINDKLLLNTIEEYQRLENTLDELVSEGVLYYSERKNKYLLLENSHLVKGDLILNDKGFGFIEIGKDVKDVYVNEKNINGAQDGDTVLFEYLNKDPLKPEGKIIRVIKRNYDPLVGEVILIDGDYFVKPDKKGKNIYIPRDYLNGAVEGHKVVVEPLKEGNRIGKITKIIGHKNDVGVDILSFVYEYNFNPEFPKEVIDELESIFINMDIEYENKKNQQPMFMSKSEVDIENKEVHCYFTYSLDEEINSNYLKINIDEITLETNSESKLSWDPSVSELDKESYTASGIKIFKKFKSLWSFDLDVNSIIQEDINYKYISAESTGEMEFVSAELAPTGMEVIIKDYSELNFYELSLIIMDMKLTNDNGETFGILETKISEDDDSVKYIEVTFEATVFDENENFYLEIIKEDGTIAKFKLKNN